MTALDDSPLDPGPPPSLPETRRPIRSPFGWAQTEEDEAESLTADSSSPSLPGDGLSPGADDWGSDEDPDSHEGNETSSPASSDRPAALLSKTQLRSTAAQAVKIGAGMAHTVAATSPEARHVGLYLADDDDARNIGHPLADLMHRRGDVVGGKLSPDANDALKAFLGLAGYLTKQVGRVSQIRQIEAAGGLNHNPVAD